MVLAFSGIPCADDISMNNKEIKCDFTQSLPQDNEQDHEDRKHYSYPVDPVHPVKNLMRKTIP